jgi:hypothetical protein
MDAEQNCASEWPIAPGASAPTPPARRGISEILRRVEELTAPAPIPSAWRTLFRPSQSARRVVGQPSDLAAQLLGEFLEAELIDVGVLKRGTGREVQLSGVFGDAKQSFVLHRDIKRVPIGAVSTRGSLDGSIDWLRRAAEPAKGPSRRPLLIATTDDEMLLLRRLGLAHTPCKRLAKIPGDQVKKLFAARPGFPHQPRSKLTIPSWDLTAFRSEVTPSALAIIWHLHDIVDYKLDPGAVFDVWVPSATEFAGFRRAVDFADTGQLKQLMAASLEKSRYSPYDSLTIVADREAASYADARVRLDRAIVSSNLVPQAGAVSVNLAKLEKAFRNNVIDPLLSFDSTRDPMSEMLCYGAADIAAAWFQYLDSVHAAEKVLAGQHPGTKLFDEERFEKRLRLTREIARLYQLRLQER